MQLIYFTTGGVNGFDKFGHFLRANLEITPIVHHSEPGGRRYLGVARRSGARRGARPAAAKAAICNASRRSRGLRTAGTSAGLAACPIDAQGDARGRIVVECRPAKSRKPHAPSLSATKDLLNTIIGKPGHVNNGGTPSGTYTTPSQGQAP